MKDAIELHSRGMPIVECECFDNSALPTESSFIKRGFVLRRTATTLVVQIPSANPVTKHFHKTPYADGYLYERNSFQAGRGWRLKFDQLTPEDTKT